MAGKCKRRHVAVLLPGTEVAAVPLKWQLLLGVSIAANILLTNAASVLLSYPIQVVFKSSKLLVAMAVKSCVFRQPNSRTDVLAAVLLTMGLCCFLVPGTMAAAAPAPIAAAAAATANAVDASTPEVDAMMATKNHLDMDVFAVSHRQLLGCLAVGVALLAEAVMLNLQEHLFFARYHKSNAWVMFTGYLYCSLALQGYAVVTNKASGMAATLGKLVTAGGELTVLLVVFPVLLFLGVQCLLVMVRRHGAVVATMAGVTRKVAAFLLSYM